MRTLSLAFQEPQPIIRRTGKTCLLVQEADDGVFAAKAIETACLCVSLLTIFCAGLIGVASLFSVEGSILASPLVTIAGFVAAALVIYAYGTRGFRRQVIFDLSRNQVTFGRINSSESYRIKTDLSLNEISSIYVEKPKRRDGSTKLMMRAARRPLPVTLLTGHEADLRRLHDEICGLSKLAGIWAERKQPVFWRNSELNLAA